MAQDIKVPKLGDGIESAEVISVLVAEGDQIEAGQALLELESDKASVEIPSPAAGKIASLKVSAGDTVKEGQLILSLEAADHQAADPEQAENKQPNKAQADETKATAPDAEAAASAEKEASAATSSQAEAPAESPAEGDQAGPTEVKVPRLGDGMESAEVINLLVSAGDQISEGQSLIELESDKASVEVPSTASGKIQEVLLKVGDQVSEGQVILTLTGAGKAQTKPAANPPAATSSKAPPPQAEQRTAASAPPPGVTEPQAAQQAAHAQPAPAPKQGEPVPAAPSVRRFARELGVEIRQVKGSGPRGRISLEDVKAYVKAQLQAPATRQPAAGQATVQPQMPDFSRFGAISKEKISNVRRATAQQMDLSWSQIPHVTQFDQADITEVELFRKRQSKALEKSGVKLTVTAILVKISALALKQFPKFNASLDLSQEEVIYKQHYHIGIAADTPRGLLVPVLRDADRKGLVEISKEMNELAAKARERKLSAEEMQGGTFTISNLGGLGTTYFTPIVNWPQVAILGVGRASQQPVWQDNDQDKGFVPRMIMPLSISYDHRLIDGADAARFLRWIAEALENPLNLLMQGDI